MAGVMTCTKYIMHIFNVLFMLTGVLILAVGIIVQTKYQHYSNFVGSNTWTFPVIFIVVGIFVTLIGILGCFGVCKESSCTILLFVVAVILVFLVELALGIVFIKHGNFQSMLEGEFNSTIKQYNDREEYRDAWSLLQTELNCCGINKPEDWPPVLNNQILPSSCCAVINLAEATDCTTAHAHRIGCLDKMLHLIDSNSTMLGICALVVLCIQFLTILLGCYLRRFFGRSHETY